MVTNRFFRNGDGKLPSSAVEITWLAGDSDQNRIITDAIAKEDQPYRRNNSLLAKLQELEGTFEVVCEGNVCIVRCNDVDAVRITASGLDGEEIVQSLSSLFKKRLEETKGVPVS